jgi:hypothetical protein
MNDVPKFPLKQIEKKLINYNKQKKIEDDINGIYDRINSKFGTSATDDNLNYERENHFNSNNDNQGILMKIKLEQISIGDMKSSFFSNNESHKSTIVEKSINLDSVINVEISNNLNANLKENEAPRANSNNNSLTIKNIQANNININQTLNLNIKNKKKNEEHAINISSNKNDISQNNMLNKDKENNEKNYLHLINKYNKKKEIKNIIQQFNIKKCCKKFLNLKIICMVIIIIIIILLFILQLYILIYFF